MLIKKYLNLKKNTVHKNCLPFSDSPLYRVWENCSHLTPVKKSQIDVWMNFK